MNQPTFSLCHPGGKSVWQRAITATTLCLTFLAACVQPPAQVPGSGGGDQVREQADAPTQVPPSPVPTSTPVPTFTPEPTATQAPTETPTPLPTATPDASATAQAAADQAAARAMDEVGNELESIGFSADSGQLLWLQDGSVGIELDEYGQWIFLPFDEDLVAADFVLKTDVTWESTSGLMACGLIFRSERNIKEGKQYYYAMTRLSGLPMWAISYLQYSQYQKDISAARANSAINQDQGGTNKIVLVAEGEKFTLYINDIRAGSFYDYSKNMLEGTFAFSAWQESGESSCTFSDTWVWALE
jgi:hypothetical protein